MKLSESVAQKLNEIAKSMGGGAVEVGFMEGATYSDGTPVAQVAWWNNFGHGGHFPSPARPFFSEMIEKESPSWPAKMAHIAKMSDYNGAVVLAIMGADIDGALKDSIVNGQYAPLSATTLVLRKKFGNKPELITLQDVLEAQQVARFGGASMQATGTQAKPLDWTSHMLNSTTYKVFK